MVQKLTSMKHGFGSGDVASGASYCRIASINAAFYDALRLCLCLICGIFTTRIVNVTTAFSRPFELLYKAIPDMCRKFARQAGGYVLANSRSAAEIPWRSWVRAVLAAPWHVSRSIWKLSRFLMRSILSQSPSQCCSRLRYALSSKLSPFHVRAPGRFILSNRRPNTFLLSIPVLVLGVVCDVRAYIADSFRAESSGWRLAVGQMAGVWSK